MSAGKTGKICRAISSLLLLTSLWMFALLSPAAASEVDPSSDAGALITECIANGDFVTVFGQVWEDEPNDAILLEDLGIAGLSVEIAGEGIDTRTTQTDELGFWVFCVELGEVEQFDGFVTVEVPDGFDVVVPGVGAEDEDSDVAAIGFDAAGLEIQAQTSLFSLAGELSGEGQFEANREELSVRIDAGLFEPAPFNPCPNPVAEAVELDPDGDWDADGIPNRSDSLPCDRGIANPCPNVSPIDFEVDPDSDWDGDGFANLIDDDPCGVDEQASNPCETNPAEAEQLAALSPADDWDSDGLVNGVDPTPCDAGVGNPCPDWFPTHLEEDPRGDWDSDGISNAEDSLPCDDEPFNPCPEWNDEVRLQFGEADWDEDGIPNRDDRLPCDSIDDDPCPNLNDLWIEQDPGGDWDGDGIVNAEDDDPCIETSDVDEEIDELDDVADADTDEAEGDDNDETPCPPNTEPGAAVDLDLDSDSDGVPDVEDDAPCDPAVPGDGGDGGGGFPWSPWGPVIAVCVFAVIGCGIALTGKKGSTSGPEDRDKKPKRPTATIKDVDVS